MHSHPFTTRIQYWGCCRAPKPQPHPEKALKPQASGLSSLLHRRRLLHRRFLRHGQGGSLLGLLLERILLGLHLLLLGLLLGLLRDVLSQGVPLCLRLLVVLSGGNGRLLGGRAHDCLGSLIHSLLRDLLCHLVARLHGGRLVLRERLSLLLLLVLLLCLLLRTLRLL